MKIYCYNDFIKTLLGAGFSIGGGNDDGIYSVVSWNWNEEPPYETPVRWHTGDPETDPWEWRIRVLNECSDVAYSKCFFNKSGYITREFYPYFLALRRGGNEFDDEYECGAISHHAKLIYDTIREHGALPLHEIKRYGGFGRSEKSKFDSALTSLQMRMYLTICGTRRRMNNRGLEYGWETTVFCTTEQFWENTDVFDLAAGIDEADAYTIIRERVLKLNPDAEESRISKFSYGK